MLTRYRPVQDIVAPTTDTYSVFMIESLVEALSGYNITLYPEIDPNYTYSNFIDLTIGHHYMLIY